MEKYDPQVIETKWQRAWEEARAFYTPNTGSADGRDFYLLEMLPYPSGTLHVGQVRNYTQGDVLTHYQRRNGRRVMRPMGFDSFGLNAVALSAVLQGRPGVSQGGAREMVPEGPDRPCERAGDRRALRAVRHHSRVQEPRAMVLPLHDLCGRAARRDGAAGVMARAGA